MATYLPVLLRSKDVEPLATSLQDGVVTADVKNGMITEVTSGLNE